MLKKYKVLILLLLIPFSFAQYTNLNWALGYNGSTTYKGAVTWTGSSLLIGPSLIFFKRLAILGPGIKYNHFSREDGQELNFEIRYFEDADPFIKLDDTQETYRNSRPRSIPFRIEYKYKFGERNRFYIGTLIERELKEYEGLYGELKIGIPLIPLTSLHISQSFSESSSSGYAYGAEARSGATHFSGSINLFLPFVPGVDRIITKLENSIITQGRARHANLVRGDYKSTKVSIIAIWDIF